MRYLKYFILFLGLYSLYPEVAGQTLVRQGNPVPADFCISQAEMKLCRMINDYRRRNNLPAIPVSRSLSFVAVTHVRDIFINNPDKSPCNFHSWSDRGPWKAFCYPRDENKKSSVWDKPKEITTYPGKGYEIIYWENSPASIDSIMSFWRSEGYFNSIMLGTGKWAGKKWTAIGVGIYENYACAWFGEVRDPEGTANVCGTTTEKLPDTAGVMRKVKPPKHLKTGKKAKAEVTADTTLTDKPQLQIEASPASSGIYYVIVKSNLTMEVANKAIIKIKSAGYPEAKILEKDGKARISVFESPNKTEATTKLREIKKKYKDAWLLKS